MAKLIEPRILKGFRDALPHGPQGEKRRKKIIDLLSGLFELAGFDPIDTPALELCEILLSKAGGETEKQIYRFRDNGGRAVALRFDLTVPLARFVTQHAQDLCFPFKRYHIAKVWRGENTQRGRYREFYQCDFDIVGDDTTLADLGVLQLAHNALVNLQKKYPFLGKMCIHVNHRGLLTALFKFCAFREEQCQQTLHLIDKLPKIGEEAINQELINIYGHKTAKIFMAYLNFAQEDFSTALQNLQEFLESLEKLAPDSAMDFPVEAKRAMEELQQIAQFAKDNGMNDAEGNIENNIQWQFDSSIARGLDYYTGMVFETFLDKLPQLGSICSGGRYDKLTRLYSKNSLPGVGGSIGLDRLLTGLEELEKSELATPKNSDRNGVLLVSPDPKIKYNDNDAKYHWHCLQFSKELQKAGIACDVIPRTKKMETLFRRAEIKNSNYLLLLQQNLNWRLRNLSSHKDTWESSEKHTKESEKNNWEPLVAEVQKYLGAKK